FERVGTCAATELSPEGDVPRAPSVVRTVGGRSSLHPDSWRGRPRQLPCSIPRAPLRDFDLVAHCHAKATSGILGWVIFDGLHDPGENLARAVGDLPHDRNGYPRVT